MGGNNTKLSKEDEEAYKQLTHFTEKEVQLCYTRFSRLLPAGVLEEVDNINDPQCRVEIKKLLELPELKCNPFNIREGPDNFPPDIFHHFRHNLLLLILISTILDKGKLNEPFYRLCRVFSGDRDNMIFEEASRYKEMGINHGQIQRWWKVFLIFLFAVSVPGHDVGTQWIHSQQCKQHE